jgi:hypothetical protein
MDDKAKVKRVISAFFTEKRTLAENGDVTAAKSIEDFIENASFETLLGVYNALVK